MLNILPPERKLRHRQIYIQQRAVWVCTLALLVTVLASGSVLGTEYILQRWLTVVTTDVRGDLITAADRTTLEKLGQDLRELSSNSLTALQTEQDPVPTVNDLLHPLPEAVRIAQFKLDYGKQTLELSGIASDRAALVDLQNALNTMPSLSNVVVPVTDLTQRENIPFTLTATYAATLPL